VSAPSVHPPVLIIGLGNPGREHHSQRHNVGFMIVDRLATELGLRFSRRRAKALITDGLLAERRIILAKPQTFMNRVGTSVGRLVKFHRIELRNLLVICDDIDLPLGTIRMRPFGGSAGHNGLRSIFDHLGTQDVPRLRLGIGRPPGRMDPADYVLQGFSTTEQADIQEALDRASHAIRTWAQDGIESAMTRFNGPLP
jgi:PTH1 family peptidyl-tRNA hydrolase